MKNIIIVLALALCACGSKTPAPTTGPATTEPAKTEGSAATGECCCELPADPPVFEMQNSDKCHTDSHGVCGDAAKCTK